MLTIEQFEAANKDIVEVMRIRVMSLANCDRETAELIVNEILKLQLEATKINADIVPKG